MNKLFSMNKNYALQKEIIFALYRRRYFGKRHTPIDNICKRLSDYSCKEVRREVKNLMKQGLILPKSTNHGFDIRLNAKMKTKIEFLIKIMLDNLYDF
jgi:hypothetical protein